MICCCKINYECWKDLIDFLSLSLSLSLSLYLSLSLPLSLWFSVCGTNRAVLNTVLEENLADYVFSRHLESTAKSQLKSSRWSHAGSPCFVLTTWSCYHASSCNNSPKSHMVLVYKASCMLERCNILQVICMSFPSPTSSLNSCFDKHFFHQTFCVSSSFPSSLFLFLLFLWPLSLSLSLSLPRSPLLCWMDISSAVDFYLLLHKFMEVFTRLNTSMNEIFSFSCPVVSTQLNMSSK